MARGLRSTPGRRIRPGAGTAAAEATADDDGGAGEFGAPERPGDTDGPLIDDEEDEEDGPGPTSVEDFIQEADPETFDRTFTDDDSPLSIAGNFDPTAGPKQAIPRVAFVLNFNLVYNPERDRWEPDTGNFSGGAFEVVEAGTAEIVGEGFPTFVNTTLSGGDRQLLLTFGYPTPSQLNQDNSDPFVINTLPQNTDTSTAGADEAVSGSLQYKEQEDVWRIRFVTSFGIIDPIDVEYKIVEARV